MYEVPRDEVGRAAPRLNAGQRTLRNFADAPVASIEKTYSNPTYFQIDLVEQPVHQQVQISVANGTRSSPPRPDHCLAGGVVTVSRRHLRRGRTDAASGEGFAWRKDGRGRTPQQSGFAPAALQSLTTLHGSGMSRLLITLGVILVAVGLAWPLLAKLGLGHLPGDIRIERDDFTLFIPLTSGLIVSLVVSLILWLLHK
jgi:hypothetical protein